MPRLLDQVLGVGNADFAGRQELNGAMRLTDGGAPWSWPSRALEPGDVQPTADRVVTLLERIWRLIPSLRSMRLARVWGGLLDVTPDEIPVLDRTPVQGFFVAAGFSGHGFCLGPITGQIIRELVLDGRSSLPLEPFRLERFARPLAAAEAALHG